MLGWMTSWRRGRERLIFTYWNGQAEVKADPLVLHAGMYEDPEFDAKVVASFFFACQEMKNAKPDDPPPTASEQRIHAEESQQVRDQVRKVFGIKPFTEGGLTELEIVQLLSEYTLFMFRIKKKLAG